MSRTILPNGRYIITFIKKISRIRVNSDCFILKITIDGQPSHDWLSADALVPQGDEAAG
jgi:hypothetical protein